MVAYLSSIGGNSVGHTTRLILRKVGTNKLWSDYSLKGRKKKKSLQALPICRVVIKACMRAHPKCGVDDVEDALIETLKHAPTGKGGVKHKAKPQPGPSRRQNLSDSDEA